MKQFRLLLSLSALALVATAVMGAASASAFTTWDINGVPVTGSTATSGALEGGTTPDTLVLKDAGTGVSVTCTGGTAVVTNAGTVNTGGADTVTSGSITNCRSSNTLLCANNPTVNAVNLGWSSALSGTRDNITNAPTNSLGWKVTCGGGSPTDTCTKSSGSAAISNDSAESAVDATFDSTSNTPLANCSLGGSTTGSVLGTLTITSSAGVLSAA